MRLRGVEHYDPFFTATSETRMLAIRLYVSALTFFFLFVVIAHRGLGILEAVVIAGTILFLILDTRIDLRVFKNELRLLQNLEKQLSLLQSWKVQR